jgi:glutathione S-transferase
MLTLYYTPRLSSMPAHIALEETGTSYETRLIDLEKGDQRTEDFLRINPRAKIPVLIVDGRILTESVAILSYIGRRFPAAHLLPADPLQEAQCLSTVAWFATTVHPSFSHHVRPERHAAGELAQGSVRDIGRKAFWANCQEIDSLLAGKDWMMGSQYTVCDAYALLFYWWGVRVHLPMHELPHLTRVKERMLQRPAVRRILEREKCPLLDSAVAPAQPH